ncbi:class I SAM-dependent methyltransferase [Fulvivirga ulvae]|uniref:class I SAM-dependent methyltransferase n=1 Tax=Fulvivirga ulvae TaxID=2904245 RepID=UPI001F283B5D|nr:class I SAM-dependent methyltransferase [Fulvivirga ulvae]UII34244.1 class I SAM-dependent methyltransferase [Fulvivirga ulvae]
MANFNSVAFVYDTLARVVFGKSIQKAQTSLLYSITKESKVLILGGGTGFILQELDKLRLSLKITYVEPSSAMMKRAKKKLPFRTIVVDFVQDTHEAVSNDGDFDVVITNFFLDVFPADRLSEVVQEVSLLIGKNGVWLLTDFVRTDMWWQKVLIKLMYLFFRVTAGLEGNQLLNFEDYLHEKGYKSVKHKYFYNGMIRSDIYKKPGCLATGAYFPPSH